MSKPLISVIVPVYKVEKYLRECLDSIVNQTYKNLEIILVDDGSPDNCPQICDEYAKKDNRIKVIHKENGGLSSARNAGLDICKGEFISFIDSDDKVSKQFFEIMFSAIEAKHADIVICNYEKFENSIHESKISIDNITINKLNKYEAHKNICSLDYETTVKFVVAWNKLYKKTVFTNIRFPIGKIHEDEFLMYKIIDGLETIAYVDAKLYFYRINNSGIIGTYNLNRLNILDAHKERIEFYDERRQHDDAYNEIYNCEIVKYFDCLKTMFFNVKKSKMLEKKEAINTLKTEIKKSYKQYKFISENSSLKTRFFVFCPESYYKLTRVLDFLRR